MAHFVRLIAACLLLCFAQYASAYGYIPKKSQTYEFFANGDYATAHPSTESAVAQVADPMCRNWRSQGYSICTFTMTYTSAEEPLNCSFLINGTTSPCFRRFGRIDFTLKGDLCSFRKEPKGCYSTTTSQKSIQIFRAPRSGSMCPVPSLDKTAEGMNPPCLCPSGYKAGSDSCVALQCPAAGTYSAQTTPDVAVNVAGQDICNLGCLQRPNSWKMASDGKIWATWPFRYTGNFCSTEDAKSPEAKTGTSEVEPAPVRCDAGKCPGTVNGLSVCVPCTSERTNGPSEKSTGNTPSNPPPAASSPITSEQTSRECKDGQCTTKTEYFDGTGKKVGEKSKDENQQDFCKQNSHLQVCKDSAFGGACEGGFTCDGDAVNCAIAREVYNQNCKWNKVDQPLVDQGASVIAGGALRPPEHPGNEANSPSQSFAFDGLIDRTDRLGASCPSDVTVHGLTLPFSAMCPYLQIMGTIVVAFSMLAAVMIVFRG